MSIDSESNSNSQVSDSVENDDGAKDEKEDSIDLMPFSKFLESSPPSRDVRVSNVIAKIQRYSGGGFDICIATPDIEIYCDYDKCEGIRVFRTSDDFYETRLQSSYYHFTYTCSNCRKTEKTYFLAVRIDPPKSKNGIVYKFGELPPFGPRTPSKLISLIGPEKMEFLKGRNCESQGLGIGAYAYYRRIVENQKNRILDEIIRVAEKLSASNETIEALGAAKLEKRFSKAVGLVKKAIPQALLINGQNPLTLLHAALSEGLHTQSDESCLEAAQDIRVVLAELAERLSQAVKDEAELNEAVKRLASRKSRK